MEPEARNILSQSLHRWAAGKLAALAGDLDRYPLTRDFPKALFRDLDELGLLRFGGEGEAAADLEAMAEVLFALSQYEPSLAVLVMEQNLAAELLAAARRPEADDWVALPLYDHPLEWPHLLEVAGTRASGEWRSIPALPIAARVLLPIGGRGRISLVEIDLRDDKPTGVRVSEPILPLGFRGCPVADLVLADFEITTARVLLESDDLARRVADLWPRAEILAVAIRSGILHGSYRTALEYARERYQGGKIIIEHSLVRQTLADLYLHDEQLQGRWRAMARETTGGSTTADGWLAEALESAEIVQRCASDGMQLLGGYGYMEDFGQEKRFRDAKQSEWLLGHPQVKRFAAFERGQEGPDTAPSGPLLEDA